MLPAAATAAAYAGPPPWTLHHALASWQTDPAVLTAIAVGASGYLLATLRLRRAGTPWQATRTAAYLAGMALWAVTCCSGLGVYDRVLFTDRAVQAVLLLMTVPLLLALGAPVTLLVEAAPARVRPRLSAALSGRTSRVLMFPLTSTALLIAPPWLYFFTPWFQLSLTRPGWDAAFQIGFVLLGLGYFWPRLQIDPVGRHYHPLIGVVVTIAEVLCDAALGATLVFGGHLLAPHYWTTLHRPWGWSPHTDQKWGGAVLWGLGDIAGVPFMAALIVRVLKEENQRTRQVDEELDALDELDRQQEQASPSPPGPPAHEPTPRPPDQANRPWWETDPRFAHRYPAPPPPGP